jgi:CBS domain-containing protein
MTAPLAERTGTPRRRRCGRGSSSAVGTPAARSHDVAHPPPYLVSILVLLAATLAIALAISALGPNTSALVVATVILVFAAIVVFGRSVLTRDRSDRDRVATTLAQTPVSEAMSRCSRSVSPEDRLETAAERLVAGGLRQLPIVHRGEPVGVLTRDDVAAGLALAGADARVADAPHHMVIVVAPTDPIERVVQRMRVAPDAVVVVAENGRSIGIVTRDRISTFAMTHDHSPSPVY